MREHSLKAIIDLCPRGEMDRCLCDDNSKIIWPFNAFEMMSCKPRKVIHTSGQKMQMIVQSHKITITHPIQQQKSENG